MQILTQCHLLKWQKNYEHLKIYTDAYMLFLFKQSDFLKTKNKVLNLSIKLEEIFNFNSSYKSKTDKSR